MRKLSAALAAVTFCALAASGAGAQVKERTLKFAFQNQTGHPQAQGAQKFADLVSERSGKKITVKLFPGGSLGGDLQTVSALQGGTLDLTVLNAGILTAQVREFAAYDLPFLFDSAQEADAVTDGPFGRRLMARLEEKNLHGLGYWDLGFRNLTNSKRPIAKAEDLDGLKIRVIPNPVFLETFKAFKANPVPMPFAELYGALEAKAVDGQENPYAVILSNKFFEVQKFVSATNHVYAANIVLVSKKFWDGLTPAEQQMMKEAANEARTYQRQVSRAAAQKSVGELQAKGLQFNEVTPAEQARMRKIAGPVIDRFAASYDPATVKLYNDELARIRK